MTILSHFAFCGAASPTAWGGSVISPKNPKATHPHPRAGFTLIELIAVMAIIAIMLALLAPAAGNFRSTAGRNGAVNILMNTLEQARVAALESGRTVYVVFHRRIFPEQDEILVLRDPDPDAGGAKYEQLTKWIKLPKGVLLHNIEGKSVDILSASLPGTAVFDPAKMPQQPKLESGENLNILTFNGYGSVSFPAPASPQLMLIVSEGVRGAGGTEAIISTNKEKAGGYEIISFRRYTGRASLEVTTL
ncbi:MAG: type II secretion system protein [Verrucomicrobia bacterium]|nr:type II secretion system protein [Verrucomicrobiota bacterium]